MSWQQHLPFPTTPQGSLQSSTTPNMHASSSLETIHQTTNGSISRFHFGVFAPLYPFQHALWHDIRDPSCLNFIMFRPQGGRLVYNLTKLPTFWLSSLSFSTTFWTWFGLPCLSIANIPQCVCTHPIDVTCVHLLCYAHGNERMSTHDVVCDNFITIA
jgi:hypothetical protein